jgi:LysR family transcriptional regulator, glycine cleavage system transcriptional activator
MTIATGRMNLHHAAMRTLPPFDELVAFEAVARHLSFTRAAEELCLTQSAISHRIRRLESHFDTPLLRRLNPGVELTEAGSALLPELNQALDSLERLGRPRERQLRVAAANALCTWWLARRLPAFMRERPGVSVELMPWQGGDALPRGADVHIVWHIAEDATATATQTPLFCEQVFPVCNPKLLPGGRPLRNFDALAALPLLHKASHGAGEWTWKAWFDRFARAAKPPPGAAQLRFADIGLSLSAALEGAGVALGRSLLAHDALADGRLVVPAVGLEPMLSSKKHLARWPASKAADPDLSAFVRWLSGEAARTLAATQEMLSPSGRLRRA